MAAGERPGVHASDDPMSQTVTTRVLYAIIRRAAKRLGTAQKLAAVADLSLSAMLRGAKTGRLNTDSLLRIAEAGGEDPTALLVAAGKGDAARRIQRLYGKPTAPLSADERQLLALDDEAKRQLCRLIDGLSK